MWFAGTKTRCAEVVMSAEPTLPVTAGQRWAARGALLAAAAALVAPLVFAGVRSLVLLAIGMGGLGLAVAGLWWALTRRRVGRAAGLFVAAAALVGVAVTYLAAEFVWIVGLSVALMVLAGLLARTALRGSATVTREHEVPPPRHPFIIMNPRSGGGKVGRFGLVAKAEALGARVVVLEGQGQFQEDVDVVALAHTAVAEGADLLGVAGGDGTQALVAGVAAESGLPLLVVTAGTRNHFALDLGLDRDDPSRCLDALSDGVELHIDLGDMNGRPFVNNASFGAYAEVVQSPEYRDDKTQTVLRKLPELLLGHTGARLTARAGAVDIEAPQAVLVSNNPYGTGDPAGVGRRPRLDGGTLGVVGLRVDNAVAAAGLLRGAAARGVTITEAPAVTVTADAPEIPVGVDGEALMVRTPVRCVCRPGALRVRVPRDRPGRQTVRPSLDWSRVRGLAGGLVHSAGAGRVAQFWHGRSGDDGAVSRPR
jgi:diacylglycerol kinase family enzyme